MTGSGSRPHGCRFVPSRRGRIGPPSASCSGLRRAPSSIAASQPGHASTSSSMKHSRSAAAASTAALRATLMPRSSPSATYRPPCAATSRSVSGSAASSSITTISAPCAAACGATERKRHGEVLAAPAGGEEDRGGRSHPARQLRLTA